jgi:DHA3 family tetracycline resistance protein-like MFS transporter
MERKMRPYSVFIILEFASSLLFSMIFTVNMVYQLTIVELNPLQLVLVGTILETTAFLFEIPTGVLADVKSRRLSVIIGYVLMGLGFIVEGSLPFFWAVAFAQVIWGFGYTFTSGATQAWMVDEVGPERATEYFVRGAQAAQVGGLVAIPFSILLGSIAVALPIVLGGVAMILLAIFLSLTMSEDGFQPTPPEERSTFGMMVKTVRDARDLTRRRPALLVLLGIGLFFGLYSEGFDRLWTAHLLENFSAPLVDAVEPVIWFGLVRGVQLIFSLAVTEVVRRRSVGYRPALLARLLAWNAAFIVLALAGFGLARPFWLALALYWLVGVLRSVRAPLYASWFNERIDDPQVRATMFSVGSQVDAIGQIAGGPAVGAIGNSISIRAALVVSASILAPVIPLHGIAARRGKAQVALAGAEVIDGN